MRFCTDNTIQIPHYSMSTPSLPLGSLLSNHPLSSQYPFYDQDFTQCIYMQPIPEESRSQSHSHLSQTDIANSPLLNDKKKRNSSNENSSSSKELLVMTIEIGNGNYDTIHIYENDDPEEVARNFCLKHGLNPNIIGPLAQNIVMNIEQVLQDREVQKGEFSNKANFNSTDSYGEQCPPDSNTSSSSSLLTATTPNNRNEYSTPFIPEIIQNKDPHQPNKTIQQSNFISQRKFTNNNLYDNNNNNNTNLPHPLSSSSSLSNIITMQPFMNKTNIMTSMTIKDKSPNSKQIPKMKSTEKKYIKKRHNTDLSQLNQKSILQTNENFENITNYEPRHKHSNTYSISPIKTKDDENNKNTSSFTPKINKHNNKTLFNNRVNNSKIPAYERLHNMAMNKMQKNQKHIKIITPSPIRSVKKSASQADINYGSILYQKGLKRQEELHKDLLEKKREKLEQEERQCTFKPNVNPISNEIILNKNRYEPPEEILIKFGKETQEKIKRQRSMKNIQEIENCSFKPEINPVSEKITGEKEKNLGSMNRYIKLFNDYKIKKANQESKLKAYEQEFTFIPQVNSYTNKLVDQSTFEERNRKMMEKVEKIESLKKQKEAENLNDPTTGRPFFKPMTGRAPNQRNLDNKPIWEHLYEQRIDIENTKRSLLEKEQKTIEDNMARSNERSHLIIESIKRKKLQGIFQALDSDNDGYISSTKIDITAIDTGTLEMLAPILYEMEELDQTLTENAFIETCERLLKNLNIQERTQLLLGKKDNSFRYDDGCTFKPQINKKSKQIAENRRPYGKNSLYNICLEEKKAIEERLKLEREKRLQEELKECSFKPSLNTSYSVPLLYSQHESYIFNQ